VCVEHLPFVSTLVICNLSSSERAQYSIVFFFFFLTFLELVMTAVVSGACLFFAHLPQKFALFDGLYFFQCFSVFFSLSSPCRPYLRNSQEEAPFFYRSRPGLRPWVCAFNPELRLGRAKPRLWKSRKPGTPSVGRDFPRSWTFYYNVDNH